MLNNIDFRPNKLNFEWNENRHCFEHNYKHEYNIFVIWEKALESRDDIAKLILEKFEIVTIFKISWNESNINSNFKRLYRLSSDKEGEREAKLRGKGTFILYILKQTNPLYLYHTTYSGKVDIMNKDIINLKESIRSKLKDNLVHSSNNIQEFFRDATLFLGYERLQKVLKNEFLNPEYSISHDIAGSKGWANFEEFFWTLNYSLNYVVLRNFEFLPNEFFENDKDVDILVDNQEEFLFLANSSMPKIKKSGRTSCQVEIQKVNVSFDAITVGDNYYDYAWQCNILKNSTQVRNIQIPRKDDYFFSLLYHVKLQKAILKDKYIFLLKKNAEILGLDLSAEDIISDKKSSSLLANFLVSNNYFITKPKKKSKYINKDFLKTIMQNRRYQKVLKKNKIDNMIFIFEKLPYGFFIIKKLIYIYNKLRNKL